MTPPNPWALQAPLWPHCAHGADAATDPVGCWGVHVPGHTVCLAHLADPDRATYLAGLTPGAPGDYRGTPFTEYLLNQFLDAFRDSATGNPRLGLARFEGARFSGPVLFAGAQFGGSAWFNNVRFSGDYAGFRGAQFSGYTGFSGARFSGSVMFDGAQFSGDAAFDGVQFADDAEFRRAQFAGDAEFREARFTGDAEFGGAQFPSASSFGPLVCAGRVGLAGTVFGAPVTLEVAAQEVDCERARWDSTATIRLRHATVDLNHAVLSAPVAVTAHPTPFNNGSAPVDENLLTGPAGVQVVSVQGVDAAHLVLTDTDLSNCLFSGAFHLDQLRL